MGDFLASNFQVDAFEDSSAGFRWNIKSACADHLTRQFVGDTKHHPSASFVGQSNAVVHQLLEMEIAFRFLEFDVLVLRPHSEEDFQFFNGHKSAMR